MWEIQAAAFLWNHEKSEALINFQRRAWQDWQLSAGYYEHSFICCQRARRSSGRSVDDVKTNGSATISCTRTGGKGLIIVRLTLASVAECLHLGDAVGVDHVAPAAADADPATAT